MFKYWRLLLRLLAIASQAIKIFESKTSPESPFQLAESMGLKFVVKRARSFPYSDNRSQVRLPTLQMDLLTVQKHPFHSFMQMKKLR